MTLVLLLPESDVSCTALCAVAKKHLRDCLKLGQNQIWTLWFRCAFPSAIDARVFRNPCEVCLRWMSSLHKKVVKLELLRHPVLISSSRRAFQGLLSHRFPFRRTLVVHRHP